MKVLIPISLGEIFTRLYDEAYVKNRFCVHVKNGDLRLTLQAPGSSQALTYSQLFEYSDIGTLTSGDCYLFQGLPCTPKMAVSGSFFSFQSGAPSGTPAIPVPIASKIADGARNGRFADADWSPGQMGRVMLLHAIGAHVNDMDGCVFVSLFLSLFFFVFFVFVVFFCLFVSLLVSLFFSLSLVSLVCLSPSICGLVFSFCDSCLTHV